MKLENPEEITPDKNISSHNCSPDVKIDIFPEYINESSRHAEEIGNFGTYNYSYQQGKMYYSENFFRMLGCEPIFHAVEPLFSMPYVYPEDLEKVKKFSQDLFSKNESFKINYRLIKTNGEIIHVSNNSKIFLDKNNNKWITGIIKDITEDVNTKSELEEAIKSAKESEDYYHLMIEEVLDYAILFLDTKGNIISWNKGAERIKGYKANEIIGKNFSSFYPKTDQENGVPAKLLIEAREKGRANLEGWRVRKDGSRFWGNVVITAVFDSKQKLIGYSKVTKDLTEKKIIKDNIREHALLIEQKNKDLEKMNDELERMNKELQSFAYISSHDLQEPLRKINTFTSLIIDSEAESLSDRSKTYFEKILNATGRMRTLIDNLLKYAQTSVDDMKFESTDLKELLIDVHNELKEAFDNKEATLNIGEMCVLKVIPFQIKQLFVNLISNSLKFISADKKPVINISCTNASSEGIGSLHLKGYKKYKKIIFSDNGIGFEPKYKEKVFKLMERLHGKNEFSGTGIGLAICRKIADNHNGVILADSTKGNGATFTLYIPDMD